MTKRQSNDEPTPVTALHRYGVLDTPSAEPFDKITSLVRSVLEVPISAVSLVDSERQWLKSIQGPDAMETPRSVSFCSHAIEDMTPFAVADATKDGRLCNFPFVQGVPHIRSYAGAPLRTPDGDNVGALCAIDTNPRIFNRTQLGLLASFAELVVEELELRRIAERDHLTGIWSRRRFIREVDREIERFHRGQRPSVLALMDLDHFKVINDKFGHLAGDAVLKAITATCSTQLRETDIFGRLGGEEFGILLTGSGEADALIAIEKIRRAIETHLFRLGEGIWVTASFGLAAIRCDTPTSESWIAAADGALYAAKRSGRNRSVFAG